MTYLLGGELADGTVITPKYVGPRRLVEVAVATLATDRALLLLGLPGTAKTWVSEHLAAAISGTSTLLVQGTSGTAEESIRYGWNYARLLAEGPSPAALVPSPVLTAMREGKIARIEELTRIPSDVQDALITILSEKTLPVPELGTEVQAAKGFSVIATANDRDRGVNDLSSALRRRFNTVVLPLPATEDEEVQIVARRVADLGRALELPDVPAAADEIRRVVRVFRELRSGVTEDGRTKLKSPSGTLSTAEAISVVTNGLALAGHFGDGVLAPSDVAAGILGAVVKDPVADSVVWTEYLEAVVRERPGLVGLLPRLPRGQRVTAAVAERRRPGAARWPTAPTSSASGTTGPARRAASSPSSTGSRPTRCSSRDRPTPTHWSASSPSTAWSHRSRCSPTTPPRRPARSFWPYAVFSPEWQALRWAVEHGVLARFIDLPSGAVLAHRPARAPGRAPRARRADETDETDADVEPVVRSDPIALLAAAAGYDDPERWWDDVIESRSRRFADSRPSPRRWPHCARNRTPGIRIATRTTRPGARPTCEPSCARCARAALGASPSSAAPGTRRRSPTRCPPPRPTRACSRGCRGRRRR